VKVILRPNLEGIGTAYNIIWVSDSHLRPIYVRLHALISKTNNTTLLFQCKGSAKNKIIFKN